MNKHGIPPKISLVDDDETTHFLTQKILKKVETEVELLTARHGLEALKIIQEVCQQEQYLELILLDIRMPDSAPLKIVLLSSSTHELDVARAKNYPVLDYINKPLTSEKLFRFL